MNQLSASFQTYKGRVESAEDESDAHPDVRVDPRHYVKCVSQVKINFLID